MKVSDHINEAWEAVTAAGVPEELQELAFKEALTYLQQTSARSVGRSLQAPPLELSPEPAESKEEDGGTTNLSSFLDKLSVESGAEREALEHLFDIDGQVVHLRPPARELGTNMKEKCLRIATLLIPPYIILTGERRVPADVVRDECKAKSCYVEKSFARYMRDLHKITYGGSGSKRDFVLGGEWESMFCDVVHALTGIGGATENAT